MAKLDGTSAEMEEQARALTEAQLTEIADGNDVVAARKAKAELARRAGTFNQRTLIIAVVSLIVSVIALIVSIFL